MPHKLYIIHGSHPCVAAHRTLALKGIAHRRVELPPPPLHGLLQLARFGARTVPALEREDGVKIVGSRSIMGWADEVAPDPPLFPRDGARRAAVQAAEAWGEATWQPVPRRLLAPALARSPRSMRSYLTGSSLRIPPSAALVAAAPVATRISRALNGAGDVRVRADLRALPAHLDRIDAWLSDGVLSLDARRPNAADLQIATTSRLLLTLGDVVPFFDGRPARAHALAHAPEWDGYVPPGALPAPWVAEARVAARAGE